jgi:branched-subunit amino acid aminotransferase/4-amino-4-deoxychorismate lyase
MESDLVCLDGSLVEASAALIPVTDPGLLRGDGVFEAVRIYAGVPYALDAHMERMERSAQGLQLALESGAFRCDIAKLLEARPGLDALVRIVATRGGHRIVLVEALREMPATLSLELVTYAPTRLLDGIKSLSYGANMLASRLAREQGADDALLVTPHGRVLELPTSSFFLVKDGEVLTAALSEHVLDSITRRVVAAVTTVREGPIALAALESAQEAFIAGTPYEVVAVHRVGTHHYEAPGPRTREIAAAVRERIAAELR